MTESELSHSIALKVPVRERDRVESGSTLAEVVAALAVVALVFAAATGVFMNSGNALVVAAERARQAQAAFRAADSVRSSGSSPPAVEDFPVRVRSRPGVYGQDASVEFTRNPSCLGSCEVGDSVLPGFSVYTVTAAQRGAPSGEVHVSVLRASR